MSISFLRKLRIPHFPLSFTTAARFSTSSDTPTSASYDDLVNTAGRDGDFSNLRYLLDKRVRDHCFNTTNTFKFITNTDTSLSVLEDVVKTLSRLQNGFARKSAFDALIARLCKVERVDLSLRVAHYMAGGACEVDVGTFYPIICSVTRKKKMKEAWELVEKMKDMGVSPDLTLYNYFLTAYCFKGDLTEANGVMKRIEEGGFVPDSRTYDALVLGACKGGKVEGALVLLRKMEDEGLPVLYSTHAHVINALVKQGYYEQAIKFVMIYGGKDEKLDSENFGILGSKLIKSKKFKEAKWVLEEMEKRGLVMSDKLRDFYEVNLKILE